VVLNGIDWAPGAGFDSAGIVSYRKGQIHRYRFNKPNMLFMKIELLQATLAAAIALLAGFSLYAAETPAPVMPKTGDKAPPVEGKDQDGKTWKLADEVGKKVVLLYFYPKDDTPGCTKEACGFRDRIGDLKQQNVEVIGVSFDTSESHQKFIQKYNLSFPLLADIDGRIADAYGVRMPGKQMARRVSFLIGLDGKIAHVTDASNAAVHLSEMQDAVEKLKKS
jgi:peroxiredoxin Q/BCP